MAGQTWYNSVGSGSQSQLSVLYDGIEVSGGSARITNPRIRFWSKSGWSDSTNTIVGQGSAVDDQTWTNTTLNGGEDLFWLTPTWVGIAYGSTTAVGFEAKVTGISFFNGDGSTNYFNVPITLPARPYDLPRAPLSPSLTRNSDTSFTLSWTANYTGANGAVPWNTLHVERWDNVANSWYEIVQLPWSALSYTDTTTVANREYDYRVRAKNPTGFSPYGPDVPSRYTSPGAPTNLTASKASSDITLSWTNTATMAHTVEVWESQNGGAYALLATTGTGATSYTHASPSNSVTHRYKLRAKNISGGGPTTLYSAYSTESQLITLLAAPNAPTGLAPTSVYDAAEDKVFSWQHNPVDSTAQTAYEFAHREVGDPSWVTSGKVLSSASSLAVTANTFVNGKQYEWRVRTWGQYATESAWSDAAVFTTSAKPTVTVTTPAASAVLGGSALSVSWTYFDAESTAQAAARVQVLDANGAVLHTTSVAGAATTLAVPYTLDNLTSYSVRVAVQDGSGLWSNDATVAFTTDFLPPATPTLTASWEEALGAVTLTVNNPAGGTVEAVSNDLYRSIDGGPWLPVALGVPLNTTVVDRVPTTHGLNSYKVVAWSATPTSAPSVPVDVETASPWLYVNGGPAWSVLARVKGGPAVGLRAGRSKVLHTFAGRRAPLEFIGEARVKAYAMKGSVDAFGVDPDQWGSWEAWEAVADLPAPLIYRDPMGRRVFCSISEVEIEHENESRMAKVGAVLTVVDHDE